MAAFNKFNAFPLDLGRGVHDLHADVLKVYLTNTAPNAASHAVKADLAEITAQNGYPAGGTDSQNTYTTSGGVGTLAGVDVDFLAAGGSFGPFRYAVLYNDTVVGDPLIGWWDYGSAVTALDLETFRTDFGAAILTLTVT